MTAHNITASVRQKLLTRAKQLGEDFQLLLTRFANERLLYRLSQSPFRDQFVLKGATLFAIWSAEPHRATRAFEGQSLVDALTATFERRQTPFPTQPIAKLTEALVAEPSKPRQWTAFLKKATPRSRWTLGEALDRVAGFASEPMSAATRGAAFPQNWTPKGPWQ